MLKQWKAQHQGEAAAAGLPADLLEAVKGVYRRLEAGAQAQVEQLRAAHDNPRREDTQQLEVERTAGRQLRAEQDGLSAELAQVKAALGHEHDERQHAAVAIAALRAESDGLSQRLADRAAEVRLLTDQRARARRLYTLREQIAATREMASREHMDAAMGAQLLDKAEHENVRLATLKAQLKAADGWARTPVARNAGDRRQTWKEWP